MGRRPGHPALFEVDTATGSLRRTLPLDLQPSALAAMDGALWVAGYDTGTIEKIDPASGRVTGRVHVGNGPVALAAQAGRCGSPTAWTRPSPGSIRPPWR